MIVEQVILKNFRNINQLDIGLHPEMNIFYGNNAQGKTNILESIYLCAMGRSKRSRVDYPLIQSTEKEAHVRLILRENNRKTKIDVHLKRDGKKGIAVNQIPIKTLGELFGIFPVIMFAPEDLHLVSEGPSARRRFIDMEMCQFSKIYYYHLQQYYKILKQRNTLLKNKQNQSHKEILYPWNEQLVEFGKKVIIARKNFILSLQEIAKEIHNEITGEDFSIEYKTNTSADDFALKLEHSQQKDFHFGSTQYGPHKDDLIFKINSQDVKLFGSQGQRRSVAISTKLAEIEFIKKEKQINPVLLLDDVYSELDEHRQAYLMKHVRGIQTMITCTGIEDMIKNYEPCGSVFYVENGMVNTRN